VIRFGNLRIRTKLALTFAAVVVPLLAAEVVAVWWIQRSVRESAEVELTNVVDQVHRLCAALHQRRVEAGGREPSPEDLAFLREVVGKLQVGRTGYPYVMDGRAVLIVHPDLEGRSILDSRDSSGFAFIRAIVENAPRLRPGESGSIRYSWRTPGASDETPRPKILKYRTFEPWGWIVAAGSYEEEIYGAVDRVKWIAGPLAVASLLLLLGLTVALARLITGPLAEIAVAAERIAGGDLAHRVPARRGDEFGALARSFNAMAEQVARHTGELEQLVSERTRALRESRELYRGLVEGTVDGIVRTALDGTIVFVNRGMEEMLGLPREELVGRKMWAHYDGGKDAAKALMRRLRKENHVTNYEMTLLGRDRQIPIRTSATLVRDEDGNPRGTLGIFTDVTARRALEEELRRAQVRLVQAAKMGALGDLVAGVAHEVNNPLMASTTMIHLMERNPCSPDCPNLRRLDVVKRCNERIAAIVNHLREFSRQSDLHLAPRPALLPLENALLIAGQQLIDRGIEVRREFSTDLPEVLADANALEQAFLNLVANARDAMQHDGDPKVLTLEVRRDAIGEVAAVAYGFRDTGPGVPADLRDRIFEPFFTTKQVGEGTGLGLSIVYGIVEQHRGRIEIAGAPGGGAAFTVRIPAAGPPERKEHESSRSDGR
jgi:PAS domain S-box-containing protein